MRSIVGPRPPLPREVEQYTPEQLKRLAVKPGLTCYWQCSGRSSLSFDEWMELDRKYIRERSLGVDLKIILKTVPAVLTGRGAC
jgi:lipopolysaccharide/colanic/teichoic acid biosynthesis glycosyltransferase